MSARRAVVLVAALWGVAYLLVPDPDVALVLWTVGTTGIGVALTVLVRAMPRPRSGWILMATGLWSIILGNYALAYYSSTGRPDVFPSAADALYLLAYPLLAAGVTQLARCGRGRLRLAPTIDGVLLSAAAGIAVWIFFVSPVLAEAGQPGLTRAVAAAYPVGDLLLLVTCTQLLVHRLRPSPALWLLLGAVSVNLLADVLFLYMSTYSVYAAGGVVDGLWWAAYVGLLAGASHRSASSIAGGTDVDASADLRVSRMVLLSVAAIAAPVLHLALYVVGDQSHTATLLGGTLALFALVIARLWLVAADLEQSRSDLRYRATHDELTGVANRSLFNEWLYAAERARSTGGVLLLDVDDFKAVNDSFGHSAGDAVLRAVASRVSAVVPAGSLVARIGGDEFAVLVSVSADRLEGLAGELVAVVREPVVVGAHRLQTSVSCGAAPLGVGGHALRVADEALYEAKHAGRDRHVVLLHDTPRTGTGHASDEAGDDLDTLVVAG